MEESDHILLSLIFLQPHFPRVSGVCTFVVPGPPGLVVRVSLLTLSFVFPLVEQAYGQFCVS
jgi:hypothetical protein